MSDAPLPPLPEFPPDAQVCGNCKLWRPHSVDHRGWVGPCRVQENRGLFPPSAPICNAFAPKGGVAAPAPLPGRVPAARAPRSVAPVVIRRRADPDSQVDLGDLQMTRQDLIDLIREATLDAEPPPLAQKWEGGKLQLVPGKAEVKGSELPIDTLFHKVVMVRDRLRVLEQKLNAHPKLSDAEKVEMQGYITRIYGSLTSFNQLFREKGDQFVGAKSEE
ncbi:MAG: hypothetical protein L0Y66_01000 [Myxococcaceae bacterium]|nr:hypothetical protein [Myxococcaceae bacterium]MCI0671046.1 hypothetical protein [Myxococcaceae bacterium]